MSFGAKLKELRRQDGLTQGDLAAKLGVGKSTVSMWENGSRKPSTEMLDAIADYFNVNMGSLWGDGQIAEEKKRQEYITRFDRAPSWLQDNILSLLRAAESNHVSQDDDPKD